MGEWIWVVCPDNGTEGLSQPVAAFADGDEACGYARHVGDSGYRTLRVFKVPVCVFKSPPPQGG